MSKGTRIYSFRLKPRIMAVVRFTIAKRNLNSKWPDWCLSDFVRLALLEKVDKMSRSRRTRPRRARPAGPANPSRKE